MKAKTHFSSVCRRAFPPGPALGAILFLVATLHGPLKVERAWAEDGDPSSASAKDADSLGDLEKVIQDEGVPKDTNVAREQGGVATEDGAVASATKSETAPAKADEKEASAPKTGGGDALDLPDDTASASASASASARKGATPSSAMTGPSGAGDVPATISAEKNTILNIEFKMDGPTSRILVHSRNALQYREVKSPELKQYVYYFDNVEVPQRLQRAFDTSEFPSPVALFTLLQMPQSTPPISKLIVQMRENKAPVIVSNKDGISIDFPAPDHKGEPKLLIGDNENGPIEGSGSGAKGFNGKTVKLLEVKNSDVQDVLRMLAKTSGYNIVIGDDVTGKVGTLSLQNVPWDQAFALVLQSKKLGYVRQGSIIRVASLSALKSEKEDELANEQARIRVEPLRTVLIPISYAQVTQLATNAKSFLTSRGSVTTDMRTNTIIVKDIDSVVQRVQKLFAALDTQPPSVSISARIMELTEGFTRSIGFGNFSFSEATAGLNITNQTSFGSGGSSTTTLNAPQFANLVDAFQIGEIDNKARTLANPSLSVIANQNATVNQTITLYVQNVSPTSTAPGSPSTGIPVVAVITPITATLSLQVSPQVANDGSISMKVMVKNEVPSGTQPPISVDGRTVNTYLRMDNGDTAVLGGIFQNTVAQTKNGIPFLMNIPILGFFLSDNTVTNNRSETFIFLTAKVLNPEEALKRSF